MTPKEKYELYQRLEKFLDKPEVQNKMIDIFTEEFLRNIPDIRDITFGNKENFAMMFLTDLLDRLEDLRISDGDFFGKDEATRYAYEKANDMLDNCLQIVHDYFGEHIFE